MLVELQVCLQQVYLQRLHTCSRAGMANGDDELACVQVLQWLTRAVCLLHREKHYAAAVEEYTLSLGLRPGHAATHLNRAAAYIKLKRWEDADADTSNALVLDPGNLKALLRRGEARMQLGQHQQALQVGGRPACQPCRFADSALIWHDCPCVAAAKHLANCVA